MAITCFGTIQLSVQDLANLVGVAAGGTGIVAAQTNAPLSGALYTGQGSPFQGFTLLYTSGATVNATDNITISLATGTRTGYNARRLSMIVDRLQNFQSSLSLPNTAPNGAITELA